MKLFSSLVCLLACTAPAFAAVSAKDSALPAKDSALPAMPAGLEEAVRLPDGRVGFYVLDLDSGDSASWGDDGVYPMMSVFKFPLALSVLSRVDEGKLDLDAKYELTGKLLDPTTWSPLREKFPQGGMFTLRELLQYLVMESDNNACDFLFGLIGGPEAAQADLKKWGIDDISIRVVEGEMQNNWQAIYLNSARPSAMAALLKLFVDGKILREATNRELWDMMAGCKTGTDRLVQGVPAGAVLAHKTGSSGVREDGLVGAFNDVGVVVLPDGRRLAICAFVSDSRRPLKECAAVVAALSRWACSEWAAPAGKK